MDSTGSSSGAPSDVPPTSGIVVGVASYNNASTAGPLMQAVSAGLARYGSGGCIILADGGSNDATIARAQAAAGEIPLVTAAYQRAHVDPLRAPYHGLPGRPAAIRTVLRAALEREARACLFLDASLTSVTPEWIPRLSDPVAAGSDYVSPYYPRHVHEGVLTKSIVYPLFRALYGVRLRQPAAGEFGCSAPFMRQVVDDAFWDADEAQTGIDLWLASTAVAGGTFQVCEGVLGPRTHALRADAPDLSATITQVVGALFADLETRTTAWHRVRGSKPVPAFGDPVAPAPSVSTVDAGAMINAFRLGYKGLREVWASVLPPRTVIQLKKLADTSADRFRLPDDLWAQIVYDFALAHRLRFIPREHLLGALTPLYLGWFGAFLLEEADASADEVDQRVERLCLAFEARKSYLIAGWRWPERFRA